MEATLPAIERFFVHLRSNARPIGGALCSKYQRRGHGDARDNQHAPAAEPRELHAGIREPLLACVRKSRDFAAAYNPLLALAHEMYRTAPPSAARELLVALEDAQPASDRARMLRKITFS